MSQPQLDLRAIIADTVRDVVAEMVAGSVHDAVAGSGQIAAPSASPPPVLETAGVPGSEHVIRAPGRQVVEAVRISDNTDLDHFVRRLVTMFENPKVRQDIKAGRLSFRLEGRSMLAADTGPVMRVESGALTERQVETAHAEGRRIVLARRAVATPLARERARALRVPIEKETR
ncbi:hypothetical protein [Gordonia phthalatica]|uniref:Uncharacterized protein n=1 Tax=Gordonia phthalatica TaxID=1136941 RepID=A0A0N9MLI1_9ACTN|nr:hypothetical protein [Gordonia phthalatica]ALG83283.1 hypothetical protein ACH46_00625 [Gordonia phthalatica]